MSSEKQQIRFCTTGDGVRYDERGRGLPDWNVTELSFEARVRDLETVVDAVGVERFPLPGVLQGGPIAIACAVRHPSLVILLALVPDGEDVDRASRLDFEQRYVSRGAKRNDELSEEWIVGERLAARERRVAQELHCPFDCLQSAFCRGHVLIEQEVIEPQQIVFGLRRKANLEAFHRTMPRVASP